MTDSDNGIFAELQKRKVFRVGAAYLIIAWLIAQVAELALDSFEAPGWIIKAVLLALALGFPLSLFLAWVYELTPDGLKRETQARAEGAPSAPSGRWLNVIIIAGLVLAVAYLGFQQYGPSGAASSATPVATGPKSIAVLPFDNLSDDKDNAFFATGVQEDILINLAKVADLRVISRSSVKQYEDSARDVREIGAALGVGHIVEGSVRRAGDTVRVTAQLIDARTNRQVWAENYDRDLANVFEIQSAIAREIVDALQANLSRDEAAEIDRAPTNSIAAYEKYIEARDIVGGEEYSVAPLVRAEPLLEEAVTLDPGFAQAFALLGSVRLNLYWLERFMQNQPEVDDRLALAKAAIDRAFELAPALPEAHAALAEYYYRGFENFERALREAELAHARFPNNTAVIHIMAASQRRLGMWDEAIGSFRAFTQLDPGNFREKTLLLETMVFAGDWDAAIEYGETLLGTYPDEPVIRIQLSSGYLSGFGNTRKASEVLAGIGQTTMAFEFMATHVLMHINLREYDRAADALAAYESGMAQVPFAVPFLNARISHASGDDEAARGYAEETLALIRPIFEVEERPVGYAELMAMEAYLILRDDAATSRMAMRLYGYVIGKRDALDDGGYAMAAARALIVAGPTDLGYELLADIIDRPLGPTRWDLKLVPYWDIVRDDPRFQAIAGID